VSRGVFPRPRQKEYLYPGCLKEVEDIVKVAAIAVVDAQDNEVVSWSGGTPSRRFELGNDPLELVSKDPCGGTSSHSGPTLS
jgi:hypothetical protein